MNANLVNLNLLHDTVPPAARAQFEASLQREIDLSRYNIPHEVIARANEKLAHKDARMNSLLEHIANKKITDSLHEVDKEKREKKGQALRKRLEESRIEAAKTADKRRSYQEFVMGANYEVDSDDAEEGSEEERGGAGKECMERLLQEMRVDERKDVA